MSEIEVQIKNIVQNCLGPFLKRIQSQTLSQGNKGKESWLRLRILCVDVETSSLWALFINKNKCISVPLVYEKDKHLILIINIIVFFHQNISLIFLWKMGPKCHSYFVYFTAQRQYTAVQKNAYTSEITIFKL